MVGSKGMAGVRHVLAPPPNRRPTHAPPDPSMAGAMLVDENQRMAEEKRRAKLAMRMQERLVSPAPCACPAAPSLCRAPCCQTARLPCQLLFLAAVGDPIAV